MNLAKELRAFAGNRDVVGPMWLWEFKTLHCRFEGGIHGFGKLVNLSLQSPKLWISINFGVSLGSPKVIKGSVALSYLQGILYRFRDKGFRILKGN